MEFKIKVFQNDEGIFAKVETEKGEELCIGDGDSPYNAVKDVCSVLADIMDIWEQKENEDILRIIEDREFKDSGIRYTCEEAKEILKSNK